MNLPVYSLENKKIIYFFLAIMLIGGIYSFFKLPKKEDSPFVIKQAVLVTQYPGATPQEVEKLITEPIEREIQSMSDVFYQFSILRTIFRQIPHNQEIKDS